MSIVDLSHELHSGMQVYPGDPEVHIEPALCVANDGVNVLHLRMGSQTGTHVDSPFHVRDDLPTLDEVDLGYFVGRARILEALNCEPRSVIDDEVFFSADIEGCSIVLLRTDWSDHFGSDVYLQHPAPSPRALRHLLDQGVHTIGLDCLSLDITPVRSADFSLENHYLWSESGAIIIENLTNLRALDRSVVTVSLFPLSLGPSDGAPIRALAFLEEQDLPALRGEASIRNNL